jgi:hypothetical protein
VETRAAGPAASERAAGSMRWRSDFSVHPEVVAGAKTFRSTAEVPFPNLAWSIERDLPNFEFRISNHAPSGFWGI